MENTILQTLIWANIGTIIAVAMAFGKLVWWLAKADARIENAQATGVRAHKRIDKITKDGEGV